MKKNNCTYFKVMWVLKDIHLEEIQGITSHGLNIIGKNSTKKLYAQFQMSYFIYSSEHSQYQYFILLL